MAVVNVPGVGRVNFPDEMPPEEMRRVIETEIMRQPASAGDRAMNAMGGVNRGIAGLAGLPVDTGENLINLGLTGYGAIKNMITGRSDSPPVLQGSFGGSQYIANKMEQAGIQASNRNPEDPASRMLNTAGQIVGGSMVPGARPVPTALAAAGGAVAGETLGPEWVPLGAMAPSVVGAGASALKNSLMSRNASGNASLFGRLGVRPSSGLVTESAFLNGLENVIAKFPGGTKLIAKHRQQLQADLGAKTATGVSAEDAGRAIERGIMGKGGFLEKTHAEWQKLDNAIAAKMPKNATINPYNTQMALAELTGPVQGAEKTTGALVNPKLSSMAANLADDLAANNGQIPYAAMRSLRTRVGAMMENSLVSDVPNGELKRLYAALSKDLEAGAIQHGAGREFARQNQYYAARMGRINGTLERVLGKNKQPEDIFKAFYPKDQTQVNNTRAIMRSLPPDERRVVTNAVVDRLGKASPGAQNELGNVFSSETFLTNWTKLSPGAKSQLFPDAKMRRNMEDIAAASAKIRMGESVFKNPSGTTGQLAAMTVYGSPLLFLTGNMGAFGGAIGMAGAANITARLLTNPKFISWLAQAPKGNPEAIAAHLARLSVIYNASDDATKDDLENYVQSLGDNNAVVR